MKNPTINEFKNLTDDEKNMIIKMRKEKIQSEVKKIFQKHLAKVFWEYYCWMEQEGCLSSYSTFNDDFNYADQDWDLPHDINFQSDYVYKHLKSLLNILGDSPKEEGDFSSVVIDLYEATYLK